jgi:hypothetical protein
MNRKLKILTVGTITFTASIVTVVIITTQTKLISQVKVTINGIGTVKAGMSFPEVAYATNTRLYVSGSASDSCYYLQGEGN